MKHSTWILVACVSFAYSMHPSPSGDWLDRNDDLEHGEFEPLNPVSQQVALRQMFDDMNQYQADRLNTLESNTHKELAYLKKTVAAIGCITIGLAALSVTNLFYNP